MQGENQAHEQAQQEPRGRDERMGATGNSGNGQDFEQPAVEPGEEPSRGAEIERLKSEVAELRDRYLRQLAEVENIRRRSEREISTRTRYATEDLMKDMIPVLDSFDKAVPEDATQQTASNGSSYLEGVLMVKKQLLSTLEKHGLEPIKAVGKPFDPNFEQAIKRTESEDVQTDTVEEEYAKGYLLSGRLLRPAMVSVAVPKAPKES